MLTAALQVESEEDLKQEIAKVKESRRKALDADDEDEVQKLGQEFRDLQRRLQQVVSGSSPAPEGVKQAHATFDIWCFGVLLFELCTGCPLFECGPNDSCVRNSWKELVKWSGLDNVKEGGLLDWETTVFPREPNQEIREKARDLLRMCLQPLDVRVDATSQLPKGTGRPDTIMDVLRHPFLGGNGPLWKHQQDRRVFWYWCRSQHNAHDINVTRELELAFPPAKRKNYTLEAARQARVELYDHHSSNEWICNSQWSPFCCCR